MENRKILMVVSTYDFNEREYLIPRRIFEENGFEVKVASSPAGKCFSTNQTIIESDLSINQVNPREYDAIVVIGGGGVEMYFDKEEALELVKNFNYEGKLVCAICLAPILLAKAGLLANKKATVWSGEEKKLDMVDATYTAQAVTVDGNIITANGPDAAERFASEIVEILKRSEN